MNTRKLLCGWLLVLAATLNQGCGQLTNSTETSAQAKIETELDKWITGKDSQASTFEARLRLHDLPLSYSIRNVSPTNPRIPTELLVKYPEAINDDVPAFRIIVDVVFKSKAGTPLTKVVVYNVTWVNEMDDWAIHESL